MSIYDIKPLFQNLLRPLCKNLADKNISANQVTLFALGISMAFGALMWYFKCSSWTLFLLPFILFIRMALNAIDGMLAREFNQKSDLGAYLNELCDIFSDVFLYIPFIFLPFVNIYTIIIIIILAIISETTGILAWAINGVRRYDGPMGKSDRAFIFGLLALLVGFGVTNAFWLNTILFIVLILSLITIYNRCKKGLSS